LLVIIIVKPSCLVPSGSATADLLDKADRCLSAWDFDAGWRCLEQALEERQRRDNLVRPVAGVARYFAA